MLYFASILVQYRHVDMSIRSSVGFRTSRSAWHPRRSFKPEWIGAYPLSRISASFCSSLCYILFRFLFKIDMLTCRSVQAKHSLILILFVFSASGLSVPSQGRIGFVVCCSGCCHSSNCPCRRTLYSPSYGSRCSGLFCSSSYHPGGWGWGWIRRCSDSSGSLSSRLFRRLLANGFYGRLLVVRCRVQVRHDFSLKLQSIPVFSTTI